MTSHRPRLHPLAAVATIAAVVTVAAFALGGPVDASAQSLVPVAELRFGQVESIAVFDRLVAVGGSAGLDLHEIPDDAAPRRVARVNAPAFEIAVLDAERLAFPSRQGQAVAIAPVRRLQGEMPDAHFTPLAADGVVALAGDGAGGLWEALGDGRLRHTAADGTTRVVPRRRYGVTALDAVAGGWLALATADGRVVVERLVNDALERVRSIPMDAAISRLRFAPATPSRLLVALADGTVGWLVDERFEPLPTEATAIAWSPDGTLVALGGVDGTIELWAIGGGRVDAWPAHDEAVTALDWTDRWLVSGDRAGHGLAWDAANPSTAAPLAIDTAACCPVAFAADGRRVAVVHRDGLLRLWDGVTPRAELVAEVGSSIDALAVEGPRLAWASGRRLVLARTSENGLRRRTSVELDASITALAFVDGGRQLLAGLDDGRLHRLATARLEPVATWSLGDRTPLALVPHGDRLAIGDRAGGVALLDLVEAAASPFDDRRHQGSAVRQVAWSADGSAVFAGDLGLVHGWSTERAESLPGANRLCAGEREWSSWVAFVDPDRLACGGDGVGLWSLDRGAWEARLSADEVGGAVRGLAVLGDRLVTITDAGMRSWRIAR